MIRFKVYGIDKGDDLKTMIESLMVGADMPYDLEVIGDVDQFIKEGIHSVPTVVIQAEVKLEQRQYPNKKSLSKAIAKISKKMSSFVSKRIIVPTDFSGAAENAIKYAAQLSKYFGGGLELVHVFNPTTDLNTGYMIDPEIEVLRRSNLENLGQRISKECGVTATTKFMLGFPIEELTNLTEEADSLVVVGATGASDILEKVFGSVSSHLARRAHSPVLIIPQDASFRSFKEVVYASSDAGLDYKISNLVKDFVFHFNCRLHSVHVGRDNEYPEWQMQAIFGGDDPVPELITKHLDQSDVTKTLNEYCEKQNADLLILATKQRNFLGNLLHSSVTKELVLNAHLPLLVFHEKNDK